MREPDSETDGWSLDSGEVCHTEAPQTFWIPPLQERENLQPGDLAKLIFRIRTNDADEPEAVERMWVLIRERISGGYLGVLDNEPSSIAPNDELWLGTELPFAAHHIINIEPGDAHTRALATAKPHRRWQA